MTVGVLSRRSAVRGLLVATLGAGAGYLTVRTSTTGTGRGTAAANAYGPPVHGRPRLLLPLDRIPPGGGVVLDADRVVLTRSAADDVHGFSAVCTHQGCTVATVAGGTIRCPCHGSRFDATTGAVTQGPATRSLPAIPVVVRSGNVYAT